MERIGDQLQLFVRRFGLVGASCCDVCCGVQVSLAQSHILAEIRRTGSPSMQQVADELGIDITTFSRQAKSLEAKGYLSRSASRQDRRVTLLSLTPDGEKVLAEIDRYLDARIGEILSFLTPFEREAVVRSLALFNDAVVKATSGEKKVAYCK